MNNDTLMWVQMRELQRNCLFYLDRIDRCKILTENLCKKGKCSFYCDKRLNHLDKKTGHVIRNGGQVNDEVVGD